MSEDPIGFDSEDDFYPYAENTPVNLSDASGLQALPKLKPLPAPPIKQPGPILVPDPVAPSALDVILGVLKDLLGPATIIITTPEDLNPNEPDPGKNPCPGPGGPKDPCKGLRDQLADHQRKLQDYARDPYAHDNKGFLGKGRDDVIIIGRVRSLINQIKDLMKRLEECERKNGLR